MNTAVIGAGIGGLSAALRLAHAGRDVEVFEAQANPGGKIRVLPTIAGPVDAGPTVLTMRPVFEELFADVGERLSDHLTLIPQALLARHFWPDGRQLDLFDDPDRNEAAIAEAFGARSAREYRQFDQRTKKLFEAFEVPMMRASAPSKARLVATVARRPSLLAAMSPHLSMTKSLAMQFHEPQLAQLFGRYATYVGGGPDQSPALLSLIWQAEAGGVWQAQGGMNAVAAAIQNLAERKGATFHFNAPVSNIEMRGGRVTGVELADGARRQARNIVFNGDPAALTQGFLGPGVMDAVQSNTVAPRSHSANVWSFAAVPSRSDLRLHNVFFGKDPHAEFQDLASGRSPQDPTLYVYAQDRGTTEQPTGPERFEIIMNAPPTNNSPRSVHEETTCQHQVFSTLRSMKLSFSPEPDKTLTTPAGFNQLFPGTAGALYGRSPHGMMAAFKRPTARTKIPGLYLAGGGCHPGAGVPMATLSGQHAAEAILSDQISTSTYPQTDTRGGTSMECPKTVAMPSRSSAS